MCCRLSWIAKLASKKGYLMAPTMKVKDFLKQVSGLDEDTDIYVAPVNHTEEFTLLRVIVNSTIEKKIVFLIGPRNEI